MRQLTFFENHIPDSEPLIKAAMNRAAKRCGLKGVSREQIVDKMNEIAALGGFRLNTNAKLLTLDVLEKWLNPMEKGYTPGHNALQVFCSATQDMEPIEIIAKIQGFELVGGDDLKLLKSAKIEREIQSLKRQKRRIEQEL